MLGRLGFQLAGGGNPRHQREMEIAGILPAFLNAHLTNRFEKRQGFDVADRAADLDDRHIGALGAAPDVLFDLVGNVRNDLNSLS
jgi:hypothetical protein